MQAAGSLAARPAMEGSLMTISGLDASEEVDEIESHEHVVTDVPERAEWTPNAVPHVKKNSVKERTTMHSEEPVDEITMWMGGDISPSKDGECADLNNSISHVTGSGKKAWGNPDLDASAISQDPSGCRNSPLNGSTVGAIFFADERGVYLPSVKRTFPTIAEAVSQVSEGDVLRLKAGTYNEDMPLLLSVNNVRIEADEGANVEIIFQMQKREAPIVCSGKGVSLSGLTICRKGVVEKSDSSDSSSNLLRACVVIEGGNALIDNCTIKCQTGAGVFIMGNATPTILKCTMTENVIAGIFARGNSFTTCTGSSVKRNLGFGLWLMENSDGLFEKNQIGRNSKCGVLCCGRSKATFDSNKVSNGGQGGFWAQGESMVRITNNIIRKNHRAAMQVSDDANPIVACNMILEGEGGGIVVHDRATGYFYRNELSGSCRAGAGVMDSASPVFVCNSMSNNNGGGAVVAGVSTPSFIGNEFIGNGFVGVGMKENTTVLLHSNIVVGTDGYGVLVQGSSRLNMHDCRIDGNEQSGVCACDNSHLRAFGCTITPGDEKAVQKCGVTLHGHTSMHMEDCTVSGNLAGNILLNDHSSATLHKNTISISKSSGVIMQGSSSAILTRNTITGNRMCNLLAIDTTSVKAEWNTISEAVGCGVRIMGSPTVSLTHNNIMCNSETGLVASGHAKLTMQLNRISQNGKDGIYVESLEGARLLDNAVFDNTSAGMRVKNLLDVTATGNLILAAKDRANNTKSSSLVLRGDVGGHISGNAIYMKQGSLVTGDALSQLLHANTSISTSAQCKEVIEAVLENLALFVSERDGMNIVVMPDGSRGVAVPFMPHKEHPPGWIPANDGSQPTPSNGPQLSPHEVCQSRRASMHAHLNTARVARPITTSVSRRHSVHSLTSVQDFPVVAASPQEWTTFSGEESSPVNPRVSVTL